MKSGRRDTIGGRRRDIRLIPGLIASALLHLLLVLVDPGMVTPRYGSQPIGAPSAPAAQFTVLSLSPRDEDDRVLVESPPATLPRRPSSTPGTAASDRDDSGGARPGEHTAPSVAERLRYNTRPFSPPVAPERETDHQRAVRETGERVLAANEELGALPPNGVSPRRASSGLGVSIPFGFKPPPPAQTVPAPPLPDSILRRDSIRAAIREAARRDSIRAARADTMKLKNVAPRKRVVIPRVVPDTTVRENVVPQIGTG